MSQDKHLPLVVAKGPLTLANPTHDHDEKRGGAIDVPVNKENVFYYSCTNWTPPIEEPEQWDNFIVVNGTDIQHTHSE